MGFGFLVLLVSLVPLSRARDLRQTPPVDRRSAPDALLGEIFNDPTATSQTKDGDNDNDDNISGSGSELWSGSGELPKPSEDSSSQSETVATDSQQELQTTTTQTSTENSANTNKTTDSDSTNVVNNTKTSGDPSETPQGTPQDTNAVNTPPAAHNVPQQSSTATPLASSAVTSQGADSKLPATEDQSQNKVVESEESATTTKDTSTPNADFFPSKTQNYVEHFAENPTAGLVSPQTSTEAAANALAFDDNTLYDPTIVKKTDIPNGLDMLANPLVNDTMDMLGVARSSIPEAPIVSQAPAVPKSAPAAIPYRGSFPLQLHKYSPYTKLMKKNMIERAKSGLNQEYAKKSGIPERSVIPGLTDAGGLRPLGINVPQQQQQPQQQQDLSNPQAATQPQAQAPMAGPVPGLFADQPQIAPQAPPAMQPFAPVPTESQPLAQAPASASLQTPQQALDQAQADVPQASEQSFSSQVAAPSDMQTPGFENTAAAFPMNASMNSPMFPSAPETIGIPPQGAQAVPVYKGLTPKKPFIEEDQCDDQFDTCPEMAKNDYCTKFPDLMKIQCRKSCHFCVHTVHTEDSSSGSSSGNDEYYSESGSDSYYESDEASGSGSSDWSESSEEDDDPLYKKSGIPRPIHQVLMAKFSGDSGSASEASGVEASSDSADDVLQTSGSGEAASGSQKKDEVSVNMAASGSGEAAVVATSASAAEIGSGSGSLAEDLATGTVSKANEKHSTIPQPPRPQQESVYPKIDLKEIAKAVNLYRGVALKMLGEALEGAAQEKEEELSKKSQIPLPPADAILQRMGFPVGEDYGAKRNMIPNGMVPNYGMMGYGNNGYAYNYPNPAGNAPLADFYNQYQQQPNMARSEIMASPMEEEPQSDDEGAAQDEQPEEIQPVAPTAEPVPENEQVQQQENTTAEVAKEPEKQDKPEPAQNKTNNNMRKSEIADPFEYVRNMGKGASMEPIRSLAAASATSMSHSNPLVLWKSSQLEALSALAKKKSTIPEPESETAMPAFATSEAQAMQSAFQAPEQQFRSDIPDGMNPFIQQNTTSEMPDVTGQTAPMPAPVFPQNTPQSEAWTQNSGDNLAARSQIQGLVEPSLGQQSQQQEGEQESSLSQLRSIQDV